jgi:peptide subunit release factor 1 (eRF1)
MTSERPTRGSVEQRLETLARIRSATSPVVSAYLNTRWADEHQRERVRIFLKNELARARQAGDRDVDRDDLDWIEMEGHALVEQRRFPDAWGVALFACRALGLREVLPVHMLFEDAFVVAEALFLRPLTLAAEAAPGALVVFVDTKSARFIPLTAAGVAEEVRLETDVPGHHRRGGWAQLAEGRYQRHIQDHRGRHFEAVAESLAQLVKQHGVRRIVMAGEPRNIAVFRKHLPEGLDAAIAGTVVGARFEGPAMIADRAVELLRNLEGARGAAEVDATLTEAAKRARAVAGLEGTLGAIERGAVHRLYLLEGLKRAGRRCTGCAAIEIGDACACRRCGGAMREVELGEAMSERVIADGGTVVPVMIHAGLERVDGVAAVLRLPI